MKTRVSLKWLCGLLLLSAALKLLANNQTPVVDVYWVEDRAGLEALAETQSSWSQHFIR